MLEIRSILSSLGSGIEDLENATVFDLEIEIEIGLRGAPGAELFYARLISTELFLNLVSQRHVVTGRYMIVMERLSLSALREFIQSLCDLSDSSSATLWGERLGRFLRRDGDTRWVPFAQNVLV